ncbi:hypothetical protein ACVWZM_000848 [Bradyrhizobium sp. USDA 4501]
MKKGRLGIDPGRRLDPSRRARRLEEYGQRPRQRHLEFLDHVALRVRFNAFDRHFQRLHQTLLFRRILVRELLQLLPRELVDRAAQLLRVGAHGIDGSCQHQRELHLGVRRTDVPDRSLGRRRRHKC